MKLKNISVSNFRSIDNQSLGIKEIGGNYTYALIGVNETGKSSFLEAVALYDEGTPNFPDDFHDDTKPIQIAFRYELDAGDREELQDELKSKGFDEKTATQVNIKDVDVRVWFDPVPGTQRQNDELPILQKAIWSNFTLVGTAPVRKEKGNRLTRL